MNALLQTIPFKMVDPITKVPLEIGDNELIGNNKYKIYQVNNGEKILIDFNPDVDIKEGAYSNEQMNINPDALQPTKKLFPKNYKEMSLKYLFKYLKSGNIVIDLGCNNCGYLNILPNDLIKIGVDISISSMIEGIPNIIDSNINYFWICNARMLPIPDSSIDFILCCDILEHMMEPEKLLSEIYRVLKPEGKAFISVPNLVSLGNRFSFLIGNGSGFQIAQMFKFKKPFVPINGPRFPDQRKHIRWFTSYSLVSFLKQNNFNIIEKFGIGPFSSRLRYFDKLAHSISHSIGVIAGKNEI